MNKINRFVVGEKVVIRNFMNKGVLSERFHNNLVQNRGFAILDSVGTSWYIVSINDRTFYNVISKNNILGSLNINFGILNEKV